MQPEDPIDHIHSGTGEGPTPGDARGPASFQSPIRNPQPLPDAGAPPRPIETNAEDDSPNGTGYWQHDEGGPRSYVPPLVGTVQAEDVAEDADDVRALSEALAARIGVLVGGAESIHVRRREGRLCLVGVVSSKEMRDAALRAVSELTDEPVADELAIG